MSELIALTDEQSNIVNKSLALHSKVLAMAAPGSGKTTTIGSLVSEIQYPFIAITFTNKAAGNLSGLNDDKALFTGTFHGLAMRILRGCGRNARILDDSEAKAFMKETIKSIDSDVPFKEAYSKIDYARSWLNWPERIEPDLRRLANQYQIRKHQNNVIDFNDILTGCIPLIQDSVIQRIFGGPRFKLIVDEWQDTNHVQFVMLKKLTKDWTSGFLAVGDMDQTLYEFRGANYANTRALLDEAKPELMPLSRTWRFGSKIAGACNALIKNNTDRIDSSIRTEVQTGQIKTVSYPNGIMEAKYLANLAVKAERDRETLAILCRTGTQADFIERQLAAFGVHYTKLGGRKITERAKIRRIMDLLAWCCYELSESLLKYLKALRSGLGVRFLRRFNSDNHRFLEEDGFSYEVSQMLHGLRLGDAYPIFQAASFLDDATDDSFSCGQTLEDMFGAFNRELTERAEGETPQYVLDKLKLMSAADEEEGLIVLGTVHAVKGLEFNTVCIAGLEEGYYPHELCSNEVESERRIVYVAASRARNELILSHAYSRQITGRFVDRSPSRFLTELTRAQGDDSDSLQGQGYWPTNASHRGRK